MAGTTNAVHATGAAAGVAAALSVVAAEALKQFTHVDLSPEFWAGMNALITYGIGFYIHDQGEGPAPAAGRGALAPTMPTPAPPSPAPSLVPSSILPTPVPPTPAAAEGAAAS